MMQKSRQNILLLLRNLIPNAYKTRKKIRKYNFFLEVEIKNVGKIGEKIQTCPCNVHGHVSTFSC